jgi:hypothetical protein
LTGGGDGKAQQRCSENDSHWFDKYHCQPAG